MKLLTSRLRLRPWCSHDLIYLLALNAEPEVHNWLGGPSLLEHSGEALKTMQKRLREQGWGVLLVEDRFGVFLGLAGLQPVRSSLPIAPATEIVWRFRHAAWGHGYACEAATAILDHSLNYGAPQDIVAIIAASNTRSINTAERIGLRHNADLDFLHPDLDETHPLRLHRIFSRQR